MDRPDVAAASSPNDSILKPGDVRAASTLATASAGATQATSIQLRFCTEPSSQLITSAVAIGDGERLKISAVRAPAKLDSATPKRISASGDLRRLAAIARAAPASRVPIRAEPSTTPAQAAPPATMAQAAASADTAETPSTPGSARGLRSSPCITAPDKPSAAPTSMAQTALGARTCHKTSPGGDAGSPTAAEYWVKSRALSPKAIAAASAIRQPRPRHRDRRAGLIFQRSTAPRRRR